MTDEIDELLDAYNYNVLMEVAEYGGLSVKDARGKKLKKAELTRLMRQEFFTARRALAALDKLSDLEREVLDRLLLHGGEVATETLRAELTLEGLVTSERPPSARYSYLYGRGTPGLPDSRRFEDVVARLTRHGLVFSRGVYGAYSTQIPKIDWGGGAILFIPTIFRPVLPAPKLPSLELTEAEAGEPHRVEPDAFLSDLFLYWNDLRWNRVSFIKAGTVGKRDLTRINASLTVPDPRLAKATREDQTGRLYFLRIMLEELELARREGDRLAAVEPAGAAPPFWSLAPDEQLRVCLRTWQQSRRWQDRPSTSTVLQAIPADESQGRQAVLGLLRGQSLDTWLAVPQLLRRLTTTQPGFLFPRRTEALSSSRSASSVYSYEYTYADPATRLKLLTEAEVAFAEQVLQGALHWLGLLDLGRREARLVAVRVTPAGAMALGLVEGTLEAPAAAEPQLIVQPNFQLFALGPLAPDVLAALETFADRVKAGRGAFEYRLTRESVYRAQQASQSVADILRFLAANASTDVPQNVRRTLEDWDAWHERIVFRDHVALCQVADPARLDDLLAAEELRPLFACRAAPTVAVIAPGQQADVLVALLDRGILPTLSTDDPQRDVAGVLADEDGTFRFAHAVPSLHLEGRLARLAEPTAAGYRLTAESVGRALGREFADVSALLRELETLHRGPVPARLVRRIKAWAHHFGDAAVQPVVLVQVQSEETLRELLADPELQPLLAPFRPGSGLALAVADAGQVAQLRARLAERGMAITDQLRGADHSTSQSASERNKQKGLP